jgi:hypothetical protein
MKKLIVLSSPEYVRNYICTDAFARIEDDNCYYLATESLKPSELLEGKNTFIGYVSELPESQKLYQALFQSYMWRYRKRSTSFYFRFYRHRIHQPKKTRFRILKTGRAWLKSWKLLLSSNIIAHPFTVSWLTSKLPNNLELENHVKYISPDLIIYPNSGFNALGCDLLRIAEKEKIKTLFLVDNWDNLSSKTVFWKKPNYLGVWGQQSKEHALTIHNFSEQQVTNIGTPRFQQYFDLLTEEVSSHFPFPYILFCGSFLGFDELSALKIIDQAIEKDHDEWKDTKVIYRPHPWRTPRECDDVFIQSDYNNTILDPQLESAYYSNQSNEFQPSLEYYPALLKNAKFVVGPLTTMLIEALICGTQVLAFKYDDGVHYSSPHNAYRYNLHFKGIDAIKGLEFCDDQDDLKESLIKMEHLDKISKEQIHMTLKYFIYHDKINYNQRLKLLVDKLAFE